MNEGRERRLKEILETLTTANEQVGALFPYASKYRAEFQAKLGKLYGELCGVVNFLMDD